MIWQAVDNFDLGIAYAQDLTVYMIHVMFDSALLLLQFVKLQNFI